MQNHRHGQGYGAWHRLVLVKICERLDEAPAELTANATTVHKYSS